MRNYRLLCIICCGAFSSIAACGDDPEPPVITDVSASATTVDEAGQISVTVTAEGPNLTYAWTGGGSFADSTAGSTMWTAPVVSTTEHTPATQAETLSVLVTNDDGFVMGTVDITVDNVNEPPAIVTAAARYSDRHIYR